MSASLKKSRSKWVIAPLLIIAVLTCAFILMISQKTNQTVNAANNTVSGQIQKYDDVRSFGGRNFVKTKDVSSMDLSNVGEIIPTLWFNEKTKWPEAAKMPKDCDPKKILAAAMNPGLGITELHKQGITGKGVTVAIIDQPLYQDHPEFAGKILKYKDFDCKSTSSMHGPAVTSLLAGKNIGTAPNAKVYYAAAPSWLADASYYARALDWIVDENKKLPKNNKIRVVSISAAPSGPGSPFKKNSDMWDKSVAEAEKAGILILDCTQNHGIIYPCWYDINDPDNFKKCIPGFPGSEWKIKSDGKIFAPTSPRTTAEEYDKGDCSYQYTGRGGLSWAIPYCAGVFALGWQINPEMTPTEAVDLMLKSAYKKDTSTNIINPGEFIKLIKQNMK